MKVTKDEKETATQELLAWLKKGDTVYTVLRHCSPSGMARDIDLFIFRENQPLRLTYHVSKVLGLPLSRRSDGGVRVTGCGMDMGFHLVYDLSCVLFCPVVYDHDAAYALNHRWM